MRESTQAESKNDLSVLARAEIAVSRRVCLPVYMRQRPSTVTGTSKPADKPQPLTAGY